MAQYRTRAHTPRPEHAVMRLDTWLFKTRLFKTRGLAATQIRRGRIRLNRNGMIDRPVKPSVALRPGYQLTFMRGRELVHIEIISLPDRRGPASEARQHYAIIPLDLDSVIG